MKNKFPLLIAAIIGIVALLAIRNYVNSAEQKAKALLRGDLVVSAAVTIPAGAVITREMLAPKEVPKQFIPTQAIQGNDQVAQIIGSKTRVAVKAGDILLWSDLASEQLGGLSTIIPEGQGAYALTITKGATAALIQPSDHIDIIGSFAMPKPNITAVPATAAGGVSSVSWRQGSDVVNVVLLQNVTVLAVGESFNGATKSQNERGGGQLTLALTLAESQLLMFAGQNGELGAVLRRAGSTATVPRDELPRVTFQAIEQIVGDLDGKRNFHTVEIQKGAGGSISVPVKN